MVIRGTGWARAIFEHAAHEVAHVDQRRLGQIVKLAHRRLRARPGGARDVGEPGGARHVDAAMDRGDPGRAGIRHHDAGGAEDRQAAHDAQTPVEGLARRVPRRRELRSRPRHRRLCARAATSSMAPRIMRRGTGLMAGSPGGIARPGTRDRADARTGPEGDAAAGRAGPHGRHDQGAVGDVRIVARILDDPGAGRAGIAAAERQRKGDTLPARQGHLDRIGKFAGQQRRKRRLGGRRGAGPGGPAPAQRAIRRGRLDCHGVAYSPWRRERHDRGSR